ncbi:MAG: hypothetical protein JWP58_126 [Hymenobacter sp.]|nr:hypothetical protein [Hymenobacter sp.]
MCRSANTMFTTPNTTVRSPSGGGLEPTNATAPKQAA